MLRFRYPGASLGLVIVVLAGCGGSGAERRDAPVAGRQDARGAEYVRQVQAWCTEANARARAARGELSGVIASARSGAIPRSRALRDIADALDGARDVISSSERRLRKIAPPAAEQRFHGRLLATLEQSGGLLRRLQSAARAGDRESVNALFAEVNASESRRTLLLQKHGSLDACAQPSG